MSRALFLALLGLVCLAQADLQSADDLADFDIDEVTMGEVADADEDVEMSEDLDSDDDEVFGDADLESKVEEGKTVTDPDCAPYTGQTINVVAGNKGVQLDTVPVAKEDLTVPSIFGRTDKDNTATPETLCAFKKLQAAARKDGHVLKINSAFRTLARQKYFFECFLRWVRVQPDSQYCRKRGGKTVCTTLKQYLSACGDRCSGMDTTKKYCNGGALAAFPGGSRHGLGQALDLNTGGWKTNAYKWMSKYAHEYSFIRTVSTEHWHWEYRPNTACNAKVSYTCGARAPEPPKTPAPGPSCSKRGGTCMNRRRCTGVVLKGRVCEGKTCCDGPVYCCVPKDKYEQSLLQTQSAPYFYMPPMLAEIIKESLEEARRDAEISFEKELPNGGTIVADRSSECVKVSSTPGTCRITSTCDSFRGIQQFRCVDYNGQKGSFKLSVDFAGPGSLTAKCSSCTLL